MIRNTDMCVQSTTEYDMFRNVEGNRAYNPANVKSIMLSMAEEQLIVPAIVNEYYEIIDGQHRLIGCKKAGLPFYFIVVKGYGLKQTQRINANMKNWVDNDYLDSFVDRYNHGRDDFEAYAELEQFMGRYNISSVKPALTLASNGSTASKIMHSFKIGDFKEFDGATAMRLANMAKEFEPYIGNKWKQNTFLSVFIALTKVDSFDFTRILQQLSSRRFETKLNETSGVKGWRSMLVQLHNYHANRNAKIDGITLANIQLDTNENEEDDEEE